MSNETKRDFAGDANQCACELNRKVSDVDALVDAIERAIDELSWRHLDNSEAINKFAKKMERMHCLAAMAREHSSEACSLANQMDSLTLGHITGKEAS
jgi:hypothetical protein